MKYDWDLSLIIVKFIIFSEHPLVISCQLKQHRMFRENLALPHNMCDVRLLPTVNGIRVFIAYYQWPEPRFSFA